MEIANVIWARQEIGKHVYIDWAYPDSADPDLGSPGNRWKLMTKTRGKPMEGYRMYGNKRDGQPTVPSRLSGQCRGFRTSHV